jgi:hypothetical protein
MHPLILRTFCKLPWPLRKVIHIRWPNEQNIETLGYGYIRRRIAQLCELDSEAGSGAEA